jgi:chromosome partitioning protein
MFHVEQLLDPAGRGVYPVLAGRLFVWSINLKMARILAVANQKGGVGKTTTAINLATALAIAEQRVLAVDMDPQGNLTSGVGLKGQTAQAGTIYQALTSLTTPSDPAAFVLETRIKGLSLIPADRNLTGAELELVSLPNRERRLRDFLQPLRDRFDFIFVDSPPSLGLLTLNALVAADAVLIPLNCEYFALEGLADLVATLRRVRASLNPSLDIAGVLMTMYDERTNLGQQVARDIREFFQDRVFSTVIPRNVRLGEAPSHGLPAILYDVKSRGAEAYVALARELLAREAAAPAAPEPHHG